MSLTHAITEKHTIPLLNQGLRIVHISYDYAKDMKDKPEKWRYEM